MSRNGYMYVPFEFPRSRDGQYTAVIDDGQVLRVRREQLGLTQMQVAQVAGLQFSQHQRLEAGDRFLSGCSMKVGLSVCTVLLLDPFDFFSLDVKQPDPATLKPLEPFDRDEPLPFELPKKVGKKPIRRDIMMVYVNYEDYSLLIPYDVLSKLGEPKYVQLQWNIPERRIIVLPATADDEAALDVPNEEYEDSVLALPKLVTGDNPIDAMGWGDKAHRVETRLVRSSDGVNALFIDLNTAKEIDEIKGAVVFMTPVCLRDEN